MVRWPKRSRREPSGFLRGRIVCIHFFFSSRRRHTRLQGDWSSDVCSSDLEFNARVPNVTDIKEPAISKSVLDIKIPLFHVGRATVFIEREWEVVSTRCSRRREKSVQGDRSGRVIAKALSGIVSREVNKKLQLVPIVRGVKNSPSAPDHKAVRGAVGKAHSRRKVSMVGIQNAVRYLSEVRILDLRNSRVKPPFSLIGIGCRGCVLISYAVFCLKELRNVPVILNEFGDVIARKILRRIPYGGAGGKCVT